MKPLEDVFAQLFPSVPMNRFELFSCGHIIPPEHLLVAPVAAGPTGQSFDFRHAVRNDSHQVCTSMFGELVLVLIHRCSGRLMS